VLTLHQIEGSVLRLRALVLILSVVWTVQRPVVLHLVVELQALQMVLQVPQVLVGVL
jgi:hypothetical protein